MSSAKKAAISLFITILIFAIFSIVAFVHLFGTFETKFYQPAVISGMESHLKEVSACLDEYTLNQAQNFTTFSTLPCIKSISSYSQNEEDIKNRQNSTTQLLLENSGLQGIRIIGSKGGNILFSTFEGDFSNYSELGELPYENIKSNEDVENKNKAKIIFDNTKERIIYSIPFYDNFDLYRGSVLFYVAGTDFTKYLISKNILSVSEKAKLVATVFSNSSQQSKGFVLGLPAASSDVIISKLLDLWKDNSFDTQKILHSQDYNWFVVSDNSGKTGVISLVFKDDILIFSNELKILLLACTFITLYLIILFIFNIKQDDEAIIRDKIKKFKIALINEYLLDSEETVWEEVSKFLAVRKHQINHDIKMYLGKKAENHKVLVENLLEKTWSDVEQVIIYHEKIKKENSEQQSSDKNDFEKIEKDTEILEELEIIEDSSSEENNKSFLNDINFEFTRPDFAILDEKLTNDFNNIDKDFQEQDEISNLEVERNDINEVEEIQQIEEIEQVIEVEETEELLEESTCEQELEEEIETFEEVTEVPEEIEEICEVVEVEENIEELEEVSEIAEVKEIIEEHEELEEVFDEVTVEDENEEVIEDFEEIEDIIEISEQVEENIDELEEIEEVIEVEELTEKEEVSDYDEEIVTVEKLSSTSDDEFVEPEVPEAELEKLNYVEIFSLTSGFNTKIFTSEKIEELYPVDEDNPIIQTETGLFVISDNIDTKKLSLDQNFQNLVDSVLQNTI